MDLAALGKLRMETERVSLADIANAWDREAPTRRQVVIP